MNKSVNYNEISPVYDERYKTSPLKGVNNFLYNLISLHSSKNILEVGCGTGHWLNQFSELNINLYGVDFSSGMLKQAQAKTNPKINYFNADASKLPLKPDYFDFIICINAVHHFSDFKLFIKQSFQSLTTNGILCIIGLDPFHPDTEWYLYKYFDGTRKLDYNRYPSFQTIQEQYTLTGFTSVKIQEIDIVHTNLSSKEILNDHFISKKGASQLALLSDEEYNAGIKKVKRDIELSKGTNTNLEFITKLYFCAVTGKKIY